MRKDIHYILNYYGHPKAVWSIIDHADYIQFRTMNIGEIIVFLKDSISGLYWNGLHICLVRTGPYELFTALFALKFKKGLTPIQLNNITDSYITNCYLRQI